MKLRFAHQLRAIAALSVVINHYGGIFFVPAVRSLVGVPTRFVPEQPSYTRHVLSPGAGGFLYGAFGVAVFFLISGMVIPMSLKHLSTGQFLLRRFLRIYPVYWCCLFLSLSLYGLSAWYWSEPLPDRVSWAYVLSNLSLLHSATGMPSLDFVCWSLGVEIKFYVVVALIHAISRETRYVVAMSIAFLLACCVATGYTTHVMDAGSFAALLMSDAKYLSFMFIGCAFYYAFSGELSGRMAFTYAWAAYVAFLAIGTFYERAFFGPLARNYTYALFVFAVCYWHRGWFRRSRVLDFLADISFPLYLVHSMIGYVGMPILMAGGVSYTVAWMVCFGLTVFVSLAIHRYVELPTMAWGKHGLASRVETGRPEPPRRITDCSR
jgi:peptidoglycan/LPS O-acetylase OafA/YrhL